MVQAFSAAVLMAAATAFVVLRQTVSGAASTMKELEKLDYVLHDAFSSDSFEAKWISDAGKAVSEATNSESGSSVADQGLVVARDDSSMTSDGSPSPAPAESGASSPLATKASTGQMNAGNSLKSTLLQNTYVVDRIAQTVTSTTTANRTAETVPPTTTEAVKATNRTTATSSERPTIEGLAPQTAVPVVAAPERNVCRTDACYRQAQRMAAMMNHTVQPCRNFYVTACGGLQTDPLLQEYDARRDAYRRIADVTRSSKKQPSATKKLEESCMQYWRHMSNGESRFTEDVTRSSKKQSSAIKKMQEFEESCMQYGRHMADAESRFAEVRKVMDNIGNFSFDDAEWENFRLKFADLFSTLIKYNSSPLFDVVLDVESKNKPTFVFKLVPPLPGGSLFSGDRRAYECSKNATQNSNETWINMDDKYFLYRKCIEEYDIFSNTVDLVKLLGYLNGADETSTEKFNEALTFSLIDLHKYMKIIWNPTAWQEQSRKMYTLAKIADLDEMFPLIDWKTLFLNLVEDHHEAIGEQMVQIYSINYFRFVFDELATLAEREQTFAKDLNNALLAYAAQRLVEDFVEEHSSCDREAYCQHITYSLMSQAASSAYLQSFTAVDLRRMEDRAKATFTLLKDTLKDEFKNAKWLDEESKIELFEQLGNINLAPYNWQTFLLNNTYLDDYYKELNINSTNYFQNAINLVLLNKKQSYAMYKKNPLLPHYIWSHFKYPYENTGSVIYALNIVVIPIGLLSKFSNDAPLPKYINMAGEGFVMARELAHMFDFVGMKREFDEEDLKLSSHSSSVFMDMKQCISSEYDFRKSHPAEDENIILFQTSGDLSANERMADYTGILIAYSTYLKHWRDSEELLPLISDWTPDQLFFLHAAQELCSKRKIYHHFREIYENVHLPPAIRVENMVSNSDEFTEAFTCPKTFHCDVFPRIPEPDMYWNYPEK